MKKNHVRMRAEKLEADWLTLLDRTQPKPAKEHAVLGIFHRSGRQRTPAARARRQ
jgi:hypothetical protein